MVIIILSYEPSISLNVQTQRMWLVVPETNSDVTCSNKYGFLKTLHSCKTSPLTSIYPHDLDVRFRYSKRILCMCNSPTVTLLVSVFGFSGCWGTGGVWAYAKWACSTRSSSLQLSHCRLWEARGHQKCIQTVQQCKLFMLPAHVLVTALASFPRHVLGNETTLVHTCTI